MPLILASNEVNASDKYDWKDVTGVQYHYPNRYRNIIRTGERFVYYRGIRRANGLRGPAEYFGTGTIGAIARDESIPSDVPKKNWAWYCAIDDYQPFANPVPAKIGDTFFEQIKPNDWRNGVRLISDSVYQQIVLYGHPAADAGGELAEEPRPLLTESSTQLLVRTEAPSVIISETSRTTSSRRSKNGKVTGDIAERLVFQFLQDLPGITDLRHVARDGETPGWDLEYRDGNGALNAVEVKGTSGSGFTSFDLTRNELAAARRLGARYSVYLVADCLGKQPSLERIKNPAERIQAGEYSAEPVAFQIRRVT